MIIGSLVASLFGSFNTVAMLAITFALSVLAQIGQTGNEKTTRR
jgi:hypothetical protein